MTMAAKPVVRVLVVEDSLTVRKRLVEVIDADPGFEVVGEASDGKHAIALALALKPDVITMDMMLPIMTGLAATEYIMAHVATPILIVSSSTNRGELFKTYDALAAGAVDVLEKPHGDEPDGVWEAKLLSSLRIVSRIKVITHLRARLRGGSAPPSLTPIAPSPLLRSMRPIDLVAIGASTGGPAALVDLFTSLPASFRVPIMCVLHIGNKFAGALADWLDTQARRPVAYAEEGTPVSLLAGKVVLAPPDCHLTVRDGIVHLTHDAERFSCRPSVDVLFESVAREYGARALACLLTGMGRDGASGLLAVRRAGGTTLAQDEATSVIYGMPREAVLLGAAEQVLPLPEMGPAIMRLCGDAGGGSP